MTDVPSVLFTTCSTNLHPDDLIKLVLNGKELPEKVHLEDSLVGYEWNIDNKYYTARVNLCSMPRVLVASPDFAQTVQGVVLYFDSTQKDAIDRIESSMRLLEEYSPDIKILVTKNVSNVEGDVGCRRKTILEWCVSHGFELVELEPTVDDEESSEIEDDFPETTGVQRIVQALNAHVWPNLVMKSTSNGMVGKASKGSQAGLRGLRRRLGLDESLEELFNDEEDDFSQLFSQLGMMKERMSELDGNDRKEAAEQVVKAFWKAMGGDDDEF